MNSKFEKLYENILIEHNKFDLLIEAFDSHELTIDELNKKYEKLLENRNMIFHIDNKAGAQKLHINWYEYFDRNAFKGKTREEHSTVTQKLKSSESLLKTKLMEFLQNNHLMNGDFDFEVGNYNFTYSLYFNFDIDSLQQAESLIREAIKMHDKIYRVMRIQINRIGI